MNRHGMKTRRHLRSARVAALTPEERLEELRAAETRCAADREGPDPSGMAPAGATGADLPDSTLSPPAL